MSNPTWPDVMKFSLRDNPVIFDVGGYKGDWTQIVLDKYNNPTVYVFEPVKQFYDEIVERYKNMDNIKVYNFGLSSINAKETISSDGDSSSVFLSNKQEEIELKDIRDFLFEQQVFHVDLIKINIEGEEYRLLEYLIQYPELNVFENYLIQFHTFIDGYAEKRENIVKELSVYYNRIFNYEMIFEGWTIKKIKHTNCLGDSHISIFANSDKLITENEIINNECFSAYRFGPYLAYNLNEKSEILKVANSLGQDDNLLICFGEIDCRAQVNKNITEETDYKKVIDNIIERYFDVISKISNKNKIVFGVIPDLKDNPYQYYYENHLEDFDCPRGTHEERKEYKKYFNQKLIEKSEELGYKYISISDYIENSKELYALDDIHLAPKKVLYLLKREFIKNGQSID
jgi:FkbM family methyltransferase